jgi:hypothetical protein
MHTEKISDRCDALLDKAAAKVEMTETALCLLSDLFPLCPLTGVPSTERQPSKPEREGLAWFCLGAFLGCLKRRRQNALGCISDRSFAAELQPFVEYFRRDLTSPVTAVRAPLLTNPVTAALMIPVGVASGLTTIERIVSTAR